MFLQTSISLSGIYEALTPYLVAIVGTLAAVIVGVLSDLLRRKFGLQIEAQHRDALQTALENAAGLVIAKGGEALKGKAIDVTNPLVAAGVDYVKGAVPDAIKKFDLTPEALAEKIAAKIGATKL